MTAISAYHEFKHKVSFDYTNIHPLKTFRASYSPSISPFKRNISQTLWQAPVWILCSQQLGQSHYRGWGGSGDRCGGSFIVFLGLPSLCSCVGSLFLILCLLSWFTPLFWQNISFSIFLMKARGKYKFWNIAFQKHPYSVLVHNWWCARAQNSKVGAIFLQSFEGIVYCFLASLLWKPVTF